MTSYTTLSSASFAKVKYEGGSCCAGADLALESVHFSLISTGTESAFIYMEHTATDRTF